MRLQENHHLFDLALLGPGLLDHRHPFLAHAQGLGQALRLLVDDAQGVGPEPADDAFGCDRADAFDQAGAKVFFDARGSGGQHRLEIFHLELPPILAVTVQTPRSVTAGAHVDAQHVTDDGDQRLSLFRLQPRNRIAIFLIMKGNTLDDAGKGVQGGCVVRDAYSIFDIWYLIFDIQKLISNVQYSIFKIY